MSKEAETILRHIMELSLPQPLEPSDIQNIAYLDQALARARAEVWREAADKAVEMYASLAISHSWLDLQGFLNYCEQQARAKKGT